MLATKEFATFTNAKTFDKQQSYADRIVAKAVKIISRKPAVNTDSGWHILQLFSISFMYLDSSWHLHCSRLSGQEVGSAQSRNKSHHIKSFVLYK